MERSEPFDAWDEGGDDPLDMSLYGPAPLPAHERTWRHPSEMGQAAWSQTEPPVAIGRGLLVTTGAIGSILGIAVLWLLAPVGGGLAPTASPTATSSFVDSPAAIDATSDSTPRTDLVNAETSVVAQNSITLPSEEPPLNTVLVTRPATPDTKAVAVAVSVGGSPFIVTTANAVADNAGFSMVGTGDPSDGSVLAVDGNLAFLSSNDDLKVVGFTETGSAQVGDLVTVLGEEQTPIHFVDSGAVVELDAAVTREGTPVINDAGALVALCTLIEGADGPYVGLIPIGSPPADPTVTTEPTESTTVADSTTTTTTVPDTSTTTTTTTVAVQTAWAGIRGFGEIDPASVPVVVSVIAGSPAEAAGLAAGDQIIAVDGSTVTRVDEVLSAIRAKRPGDIIVFTVVTTQPPDAVSTTAPTERSITVVLGVYEPAV